jgi:hypothetical protein
MAERGTIGPDVVIAGSARSGTSFLASLLGGHPGVDPGSVKESNYFSRELDRGPDWYDRLYAARRPGLLRLDASMSYTFTHFPEALANLAREAPDAVVVYAVRHPLRRLLSHYQLHRDYFKNDPALTLGAALAPSGAYAGVYTGASDYALWLPRLSEHFGTDRLIVVPFPVVTGKRDELVDVVCSATGLDPAPLRAVEDGPQEHRNQVVQFRSGSVRRVRRMVRRAGLYPALRRTLGSDRLRRLRSWSTRPVETEPLAEALSTCSEQQREELRDLYDSARNAAAQVLAAQDARLGLDWAGSWSVECPELGSTPGAAW